MRKKKPTKETYGELNEAYDYFNESLFDQKLPPAFIMLTRKSRTYGYFRPNTWENHQGAVTDEIALNPDHFKARSIQEVLSTLVHEMVHLSQHHFGQPSRGGYHNWEWAEHMEKIGLIPSATGEPDGPKVGQKMSQYIQPRGPFDRACKTLLRKGYTIPWHSLLIDETKAAEKKPSSKIKYSCPKCDLNCWAKPQASLVCGACLEPLISQS